MSHLPSDGSGYPIGVVASSSSSLRSASTSSSSPSIIAKQVQGNPRLANVLAQARLARRAARCAQGSDKRMTKLLWADIHKKGVVHIQHYDRASPFCGAPPRRGGAPDQIVAGATSSREGIILPSSSQLSRSGQNECALPSAVQLSSSSSGQNASALPSPFQLGGSSGQNENTLPSTFQFRSGQEAGPSGIICEAEERETIGVQDVGTEADAGVLAAGDQPTMDTGKTFIENLHSSLEGKRFKQKLACNFPVHVNVETSLLADPDYEVHASMSDIFFACASLCAKMMNLRVEESAVAGGRSPVAFTVILASGYDSVNEEECWTTILSIVEESPDICRALASLLKDPVFSYDEASLSPVIHLLETLCEGNFDKGRQEDALLEKQEPFVGTPESRMQLGAVAALKSQSAFEYERADEALDEHDQQFLAGQGQWQECEASLASAEGYGAQAWMQLGQRSQELAEVDLEKQKNTLACTEQTEEQDGPSTPRPTTPPPETTPLHVKASPTVSAPTDNADDHLYSNVVVSLFELWEATGGPIDNKNSGDWKVTREEVAQCLKCVTNHRRNGSLSKALRDASSRWPHRLDKGGRRFSHVSRREPGSTDRPSKRQDSKATPKKLIE
mmetsp:Transcript_121607/g.224094  ORF Transcript_121607/g.224094 Transcript_121607/m.224094 type:complete len:618 (+) Transcript_121607:80-1933(+)